MADMADDEKAVIAESPTHPEAPPVATTPTSETSVSETSASEKGAPETGSSETIPAASEAAARPLDWTASDSRGPLETAAERDAFQRSNEPAPSHETGGEHPIPGLATAPLAEPTVPVAAKRSVLPIAAGIVIGALIGAGTAALVYTWYGSQLSVDPQVASLAGRIDALEKRPDPQTDIAGLKQSVADLTGKVAALQKPPAAQKTPAGISALPAPPAAVVDLAPLQQKIAGLQTSIAALQAQSADAKALAATVATLQGDVAGAKTEGATTQAAVASVTTEQKLLAGKVMVPGLAVVADSLVQQIDQGQPYAAQVDALTTLGADPTKIAVLRQNADKGVPSAKTLAAAFEPLAEPISATAHKAPPNAGFVDRLKSGMFSMVSVRSADDTSGDDLPSRVARIKADLAHDDVTAALATWDTLPADAKTKGEAWSALAKTSAEAMTAARALQHDAIAALGAKKS